MSEFSQANLDTPSFENILIFRARCLSLMDVAGEKYMDIERAQLVSAEGVPISLHKNIGSDPFATWDVSLMVEETVKDDKGISYMVTTDYSLGRDCWISKTIESELIEEASETAEPPTVSSSREGIAHLFDDHFLGLTGREGALIRLAEKLEVNRQAHAMGLQTVSGGELEELLQMLATAQVMRP